jgi:sulfide:quinone oxidoreductase
MRGPRTVLVLGGGVGGLVAANRLRRNLPERDSVVLIDREPDHLFAPSLLWLAVGSREPSDLRRPLARLRRKGIEVVTGEIEAIDPAGRRVRIGGVDREADAIVVSLGAAYAPEAVPGLSESGRNAYTMEGAAGLRADLERFGSGRIVVLTASPAYKCPAAPYELALLIEGLLRRRGVREACRIDVVAAEPAPMGVAGPHVSAAVRGLLAERGIGYHPGLQVREVDPGRRMLTLHDGTATGFDLLAFVPPHRAPEVVRESGLTAGGDWIPVDRATLQTGAPGVYAIGDVVTIPLAVGKPLPKAGVFAHRQAEVVAANIAAEWSGETPRAAFDGYGYCFIEIGDGRAGYGAGNFYAEPTPEIRLRGPGRLWHAGKVLFEKTWWRRWL